MKLVKDVGVTITYDNILTEVRIESNNYVLEMTEQQVNSVEVAYHLYNYGQCDIISVYNYINEFIDDYNSFSDFEKQFCQSIGIFGSESFTDSVKRKYVYDCSHNYRRTRNHRLSNVLSVLSYGQEQGDIQIGYALFEEKSERYIMVNSDELLAYFYSNDFLANPLYTIDNKTEVIAILEI